MRAVSWVKAGKIAVLGATCGLLAAAVHVSALIGTRQQELKLASRCEVCVAASQVELEFARLEQRIAAVRMPHPLAAPEDVRLRLDRLDERVSALRGEAFRDFTRTDPASAETLERLDALVATLSGAVDRIDRPGAAETALSAMAPLDFDLSRLAAEADRFGRDRADAAQAELMRLFRVFTSVLVGFFAFGVGLLAVLGWHNRQLGLARDGQQRAAEDLGAASARLAAANGEITAVNGQLQARNASLDRRDREISLQNQRFDAALNNMSMALCMVDAGDRLVVYNQRFAEFFGLDMAPIPGLLIDDLAGLAAERRLRPVLARQRALASAGDVGFVEEIGPAPGSTEPRTLAVAHRPMRDGGWVATYEDITERRQAESRIAFLARHDPLTGLCNRAFFAEQVDAVLAEARRRGAGAAVLCLDVDGFKEINESLGPAVGDALLCEVARRLTATAGGGVVARLGADEFALVATGAAGGAWAADTVGRVMAALHQPFAASADTLELSVSLGHAVAPGDGDTAETLSQAAGLALVAAKAAGGGVARGFAPDMDAVRRARRALEGDLRRALPNGEFELFFQPLVDARRVAVTGFEALLRWRHPVRGLVSPAEFIPIAEESGLIGAIGRWALGEACAQAARWPGDLTVAVNLSPVQFGLMDLVGERRRGPGQRRPRPDPPRTRDHRDGAARRRRLSTRCTRCGRAASASPWTISAPATPR